MNRKKNSSGNGEPVSFEKALARLEQIVKEMEEGDLSLEAMMAHFEEGQGLVKICADKLNQVERKIEVLVKEGNQVVAVPFEAEEGAEEDEGSGAADGKSSLPF